MAITQLVNSANYFFERVLLSEDEVSDLEDGLNTHSGSTTLSDLTKQKIIAMCGQAEGANLIAAIQSSSATALEANTVRALAMAFGSLETARSIEATLNSTA